MTNFTAFYFIDADTAATHLFAFDRNSDEWRVPCGLIPRPHKSQVTYAPTKPMCKRCVRLTDPKVTRRIAPRTPHR